MGIILMEDTIYCCDLCGKQRSLSEMYKDTDQPMFKLEVEEIVSYKADSRVIAYKEGYPYKKKTYTPLERKHKKYIVCNDCISVLDTKQDSDVDKESTDEPIDNEIRLREWSGSICNVVERLLESKNITIPNDDRTGDADEARIYGTDYYNLENDIVGILEKLATEIKSNPDKPITDYRI